PEELRGTPRNSEELGITAGRVLRWRETANTAAIDVAADGTAFLVMSVTAHKYWSVTIDGVEVPSVLTNLGYQGVVVPRGRHLVVMRYRNPMIAAGAAISAATLLALLFFGLRRRASTMRDL
nr:YfhO family protein [Acidobacteriota bacterium]